MNRTSIVRLLGRCLAIVLLVSWRAAYAEFLFNFAPVSGQERWSTHAAVNYSTGPAAFITQTRFMQRDTCYPNPFCPQSFQGPGIVTDPVNGRQYFHVAIGDMADGFIQEVFIEIDSGVTYGGGVNSGSMGSPWDPVATWNEGGSASGAELNDISSGTMGPPSIVVGGNQVRVFSKLAGNGSGDPRKVIINQQIDTGGIAMSFIKDTYLGKPKISQTITGADVTMVFEADMRPLTYSQADTPISITNTLVLADPELQGLADFDMATDATSGSRVSAGRYIYTPGNYAKSDGYGAGSGGTYQYAGGSFDHYDLDWHWYIDDSPTNLWTWGQEVQ